jgi:hypothetical protein
MEIEIRIQIEIEERKKRQGARKAREVQSKIDKRLKR